MTFEDFKKMAKDPTLSYREKIGFADCHRAEKEQNIFPYIYKILLEPTLSKHLKGGGVKLIDIGCGCSTPTLNLIDFCLKNKIELYLVDCQEMLDLLPSDSSITKIAAEFPNNPIFEQMQGMFDYVLTYSVIQVVPNFIHFIHHASLLLNNQGRMLIGDIPNLEKKKRFLNSKEGKLFHKQWSGSEEIPLITQEEIDKQINDKKVFSILSEYRSNGYESYLLEQDLNLPLAYTREDILIVKH